MSKSLTFTDLFLVDNPRYHPSIKRKNHGNVFINHRIVFINHGIIICRSKEFSIWKCDKRVVQKCKVSYHSCPQTVIHLRHLVPALKYILIFKKFQDVLQISDNLPEHSSLICTVSPISSGNPCLTFPSKLYIAEKCQKRGTQYMNYV